MMMLPVNQNIEANYRMECNKLYFIEIGEIISLENKKQ
jgi:hypothetical protein